MVLPNKPGITDPVALAHEEERVSKAAALRMYQDGTLEALEPGRLATLAAVHERIFGDLYDFAGKVRTVMNGEQHEQLAPRAAPAALGRGPRLPPAAKAVR